MIKQGFIEVPFNKKSREALIEQLEEWRKLYLNAQTEEEREVLEVCINTMVKSIERTKTRGFEEVAEQHKVHEGPTTLPTRGTEKSGGYDLYVKEDLTIKPGEQIRTWFDVKAYMQDDEVLKMYTRSSIGCKLNIMFSNQTGVIDSDFYENPTNDGNISAFLYNYGNETINIKSGDRVAQGVFVKYLTTDDDAPLNAKRTGGVGSSGK